MVLLVCLALVIVSQLFNHVLFPPLDCGDSGAAGGGEGSQEGEGARSGVQASGTDCQGNGGTASVVCVCVCVCVRAFVCMCVHVRQSFASPQTSPFCFVHRMSSTSFENRTSS